MTADHIDRVPPATQRMPSDDQFPTGPALGETFPDFTLVNQRGETINLRTARAGSPAIVIFERSARW